MRRLSIVPFLLTALVPAAPPSDGPFLVQPYLQLGASPDGRSLAVLWQAESDQGNWRLEWKAAAASAFQPVKPVVRRVALGKRHFIYLAALKGLTPGEAFGYRVLLDGKPVFQSEGHAPPASDGAYKFAVFGDCGADTSGQRQVAGEVYKFKPDFVFIPGDVVYWSGLASEYQKKFFPIYNSDETPLMRSTVFMASLGNHDVGGRDLASHPDGLAYFYNWNFPLNGLASFVLPGFKARDDQSGAELNEASGGAFPRMSNYSFVYGNSFWLVLDSNPDVDWSRPELTEWVTQELNSPAARQAVWRFAGFHHPPFSSSHMHAGDQQMRVLAKTFEDGKVDVVFSGHVHNYQRSAPLRFKLTSYDASKSHQASGEFEIDRKFDGKTHTRPSGVIYLVTGAGGEFLYDKGQGRDRKSWKDFTVAFVSDVHSFTAVEMQGEKAVFRQVDEKGREVDSFTVTRSR